VNLRQTARPAGGVFVSGTDTGIGKTFIACALARHWRGLGLAVAPRKPVESGCPVVGGEPFPADGALLAEAAGLAPESIAGVTRFRLTEPLAPDLAARLAGQRLWLRELVAACDRPAGAWRITEGAGGLYSPLCEDGLNADLAQVLGDPVVLVAEDRLGTLSGCLLAMEALERRGLKLAAVVLNRRPAGAHPAMDNAGALARYTAAPVIVVPAGLAAPEADQSFSTWSSSMVSPPEPGSSGAGSP
jgi:dethiobiotin synthetase